MDAATATRLQYLSIERSPPLCLSAGCQDRRHCTEYVQHRRFSPCVPLPGSRLSKTPAVLVSLCQSDGTAAPEYAYPRHHPRCADIYGGSQHRVEWHAPTRYSTPLTSTSGKAETITRLLDAREELAARICEDSHRYIGTLIFELNQSPIFWTAPCPHDDDSNKSESPTWCRCCCRRLAYAPW